MTRFKAESQPGKGALRASARLPALDVEIVHHAATPEAGEQILIHLRADPSFAAFANALEGANPFLFWAAAARMAWLPWLEAARLMLQPFASGSASPPPPEVEAPSLAHE